jgi:crossover junction endodeoxyribonuclease RuvC
MSKAFIGIDPGKTGAIAIIIDREIKIYDFGNPIIHRVLNMLKGCRSGMHAVLEKVHAMPGQGVSSMFSFGEAFGWWEGVLDALCIPYDLITPQKWQKRMFDYRPAKGKRTAAEWTKLKKELSLERARRLYPQARDLFLTRKKDHNRADALLIAGYCKIRYE